MLKVHFFLADTRNSKYSKLVYKRILYVFWISFLMYSHVNAWME